ncbi:uncharacterized protein LOC111349208 isoform X1 [Spodoptera litura]|uniref:Uncharacterized protein LOC111349208 isoform X1 n=1 Tax=Spodoptera litura TaxID=69820 RepID=A0A9J7IM11_SPOLT|nr:uncharacterized protein LOC111349208 isoform X1 [Spodoptera litura]
MEALYDDLSNYEDVNSVVELREENKELKVKLQEHAAAMEKLQKDILQDYDKLELEFKMLEHNYSSLLKTARSEIERKTKMISELNKEKDMMVLDALKSGKHIRRHFKKPMSNVNSERVQHDKYSKERGNDKHQKEEPPQRSFERKETTMLPAQDRFPDSGTCTRNKYERSSTKADYSDRKNNVKENVPHQKTEHYNPLQLPAGSIKDRRKSMPAASASSDILSSDEDFKRNIKTKDTRTDNRNLSKVSLDRHSNKNTESSYLDDRTYNYQGSIRDMHKSRTSRYDISPHRGRDNYEAPPRYRKHPSAERVPKRLHRDHQDDYYRQEQRRHPGKSLESSPKSHSRHRQRLTENQPSYEKHEQDKHRHQYENKQNSTKHRQSSEYDEPLSKRQRIESLVHSDTHFKEDRRHYPENQPVCTQPMPAFSPHEYDSLHFSCQSPDSEHMESAYPHPIKEIMAVAAIPLEDPRLSSLKYAVIKVNGKDILTTRVGLNVDLKPIDRSHYGVHPVNVPTALVRRPSTDSIISDIYRDVGNPITSLNASFESGEVRETDYECHDIYDIPYKQSKCEMQPKQVPNVFPKQTKNVATPASQPNLEKYVIPKIYHNSTTTSTNIDVPMNYPRETVSNNKDIQKKDAAKDSLPRKSLSSEHINEGPVTFPNNNSIQKENQSQVTLNKMAMVAGDLELSDDTSDNVDIHKHVMQEKVQKTCKSLTNIDKDKKETESLALSKLTTVPVVMKPVDDKEIRNTAGDVKNRELESINKKQKSKKSKGKSKSKEMSKDFVESLEANTTHAEKKVKIKKDKEIKPKKNKEKFSDLFGDSNSLVTPEDLGIPTYIPISEDAQDAVDMKIDKAIAASLSPLDKEEIDLVQTHHAIELKETTTVCDVLRATESMENHELPSPIVYENLNPGIDSNDTGVVKTVIISTGVQPGIPFDVNTQVNRHPAHSSMPVDVNSKPTALEHKKHDNLKALATSTPQKEFTAKASIESEVGTMESTSKSDMVKAVLTISNAEPVAQQTDANTDSHDAPDVRIFMKRRRKVIKRPQTSTT